jgi:hypothetical protein
MRGVGANRPVRTTDLPVFELTGQVTARHLTGLRLEIRAYKDMV